LIESILYYFNNRSTNASAESFNAKKQKLLEQYLEVLKIRLFYIDCPEFMISPQHLRMIRG